jgi:membrane protease YdiL (CAAX protease family)
VSVPAICADCGGALKPSAAFCAACGRACAPVPAAPPAQGSLVRAIMLYVALLVAQLAVMVYARVTKDAFPAEVGGTLLFAAAVLWFYLPVRQNLASTSRSFGLRWPWALAIVAGSVVIAAIVAGYVHGLASLFGIHAPSELAGLEDHPWPWSIALVVIVPPLVEELAFRGVIYGGLRTSLSVGESLIVSSFAFAMIHMSIPTMLTHFPLGLYFGWLRHRSGSLWPGMLAHACHNAVFVALAWT